MRATAAQNVCLEPSLPLTSILEIVAAGGPYLVGRRVCVGGSIPPVARFVA